jgi:hypothetical protein
VKEVLADDVEARLALDDAALVAGLATFIEDREFGACVTSAA